MRLWGRRVMAVDDDADSLDVLSEVLGREGAEVIGVGAAAYALPAVVFLMPDVLIVDVAMPGEDGVSLVRRLRALPADQGGRIPALALTALAPTESARDQWRQAGIQRHVGKPFDPEHLIGLVAELSGQAVERRRRGLAPDLWPPDVASERRSAENAYQRGRASKSDSASAEGSPRAK
jgi:CheY-like chemotaxis protein